MPQEFFNPVRSLYGMGALARLPDLLAGRRATLVTFPEAHGLGLVQRITDMLGDQLAGVLSNVQPNPDVAELRAVYEDYWCKPDHGEVLIALGGGSAIDTAKALMVASDSNQFDALLDALGASSAFVPSRVKTLIAIPTTAGTGSEVTPWATIWDRKRQIKHSLHLQQTWPSIALIDPELMLSLPLSVTLHSGLDALSHALEAIWNVNANPISDTFAVAATRETLDTLPELMKSPGDVHLRARMALAALKAGMAFSNTRTALAHSISYEMTLRHGLPHGLACSFSLPMVLERALGQQADRDRVLALALGGPLSDAAQRLTRFIENLGVATRFADYGVSTEMADKMVAQALQGARGRNFIGTASPHSA